MILKNLTVQFREDEIEWRLDQVGMTVDKKIWGRCLAYVSARAIMDRLDDVCGPENWEVKYEFIAGKGVICRLSIQVEDGLTHLKYWVTKEDGAEETDFEPFKGGISSALKRAGNVWGMGRYLYNLDAGFIRIVEKGTPGARYGKTKENQPFYWVPPALPDWALPPKKKPETSYPIFGAQAVQAEQSKQHNANLPKPKPDPESFDNFRR